MSRCFEAGGETLWNPSNGVADLFVRTADMLAAVEGRPTGIGPSDEIDLDLFAALTDALVARYLGSRHPIMRSLLEGFAATAVVLVRRGGRPVAMLPARGVRDISVTTAGMAAPGSADRLLALAAAHDLAMPT